ncbi:MAG: iron ABC transporter permease [Desulfurococcales archaeon]|nr:iron ABC transporter permease [Desulfurococcales archaeon]
MQRPSRVLTMKDLLFGGLIIAIVYIILQSVLDPEVFHAIEVYIWVAGIAWAIMVYKQGFDPTRLLFSFTWSFIVIFGLVYIMFILVLGIEGYPRALAILLSIPATEAIIGYFRNKYVELKAIRARRAVKINLTKKMRSALFKLDPIMIVFIIASFAVLLTFLVTPVLMMLYHAFEVPEDAPWYHWFERIFTNIRYVKLSHLPTETPWTPQSPPGGGKILVVTGVSYGILLNSLINATIVTSVATVLGIIVAFMLARYDFPGKTFFRILAIVPLFITPFINAYVIKILFSEYGPISFITNALLGYSIRIDKLAGVALAQIIAFYPIVYLNAYSSFLSIDPSMEEQAENLGSKGLRLFFTVTLPLALPGIAAGSILVFIFSLEDLGAPIVFQEHELMSYQIWSSLTTETGMVTPEIAALGFVMLGLAVVGFIAIRSYVGMRAYAMISRGGRWQPRERRLGWKGLLVIYLVLLPLIIFTAMPQIGVILMAFNILPPTGFQLQFDKATLDYFIGIFTYPDINLYIRNTLIYATIAVLLATIVALITAYSVSRTRIKVLTPALDTLTTIPIAIPGLVIALGYFYFYSTYFKGTFLDPTTGPGNFQAWIVLIIAYSIRKLPFVARSIFAGFQQVHEALEEAALNLGAKRLKTILTVVLPLIVTYIISGALIGFIYISTEVSTSVTIGALSPQQAPMTFYMMNIYKGGTAAAVQYVAAMGLLLILFQLAAVLTVTLVFKQRYAFIGV